MPPTSTSRGSGVGGSASPGTPGVREGTPQRWCQLQLLPVASPPSRLPAALLPGEGPALLSLNPSLPAAPGRPLPQFRGVGGDRLWSSQEETLSTRHLPDEAGRGATQAVGQEEGPFPSRPPPLPVSSECGNARHVPGWGTQAPLCPHTAGKTSLLCPPKKPSPNFPQDAASQPRPEAPISGSQSGTSVDIPHAQGTPPAWESREHEGVRTSPRGQGEGQAVSKSDVSGASVLPAL